MQEPEPATPFAAHHQIAQRYELLRLIGGGGMGEVWEARHLELDAPVAIKFALARRLHDKSFVARFRREACTLARIRVPNVVQVFDAGTHEGYFFIVMELLLGESLKARLERIERLSLSEFSPILDQIARALAAIHSAGLVHRDVTPANTFLTDIMYPRGELHVKLLDFGIVKEIAAEIRATDSGVVVGSPAYMSPEQARAERVDKRSDLWSLGALTFRALTGRDPFPGRCVTDVLFAVCTGEIPSVGPEFTPLTAELDGFFARALARNPAHRFEDAAQMAAAFSAIVRTARERPESDSESAGALALQTGLSRLGPTTDFHPGSGRRPSKRRAAAALGQAAVLLGVGVVTGYSLSVWYPNAQRPVAATAAVAAPGSSRAAVAFGAASHVTSPGPARVERSSELTSLGTQVVLGGASARAAPSARDSGAAVHPPSAPTALSVNRDSLVASSKRRAEKVPTVSDRTDALDPVFGLPVQQ